MNNRFILDIEADGLLDNVSKIYCLCYTNGDINSIVTLTEKEDIIPIFLNKDNIIIGHNIIDYDVPVIEKVFNIKNKAKLLDTLALSYYLYPFRNKHSIESYGDIFGLEKVKIDDWKNLSQEQYIERCKKDVEITTHLYNKEMKYLYNIYDGNYENIIKYLNFKMNCLFKQSINKIKINKYEVLRNYHNLDYLSIKKILILDDKIPKVIDKVRPKKYLNKNGGLTKLGEEWKNYLISKNLPEDTEVTYKKGNSVSIQQLKNWLFSLGWIPNFYKLNEKGEKVPQISEDGELTTSVKKLIEIEPALKELDSLTRINHRKNIFKGFLDYADENGYIIASAHGFTNTLRLKHIKPTTNLPKTKVFYGKEIRSSFICEENELLVGIDIKGLEANTADHWIYFFDPEYVKQKQQPGFDSHLNLGVVVGLITEEESDFHKKYRDIERSKMTQEEIEKFERIDSTRFETKTANFSLIYGAGPQKLSDTTGISIDKCRKIHKSFWEINKGIRQVSNRLIVKEIFKQKWMQNPLNKFWYFVKSEKDLFSLLNQGKLCSE